MNGTSELLLVSMIDDYEVGKSFQHWGKHITIVPWFQTDEVEAVIEVLRQVCAQIGVINLTIGGDEMFGPRQIPVKLIEPSESLTALHTELIRRLGDIGIDIAGRYTGNYYRPHVSLKRGATLDITQLSIGAVQLAEALPQGYRKIVQNFPLEGEK